jgi:lysine-N-methylase
MKIRTPAQDAAFRCLAGDCPDTCCAGWEIPVDEESEAAWETLPEPWRSRMASALETVDGERQLRRRSGRCALLTEKNLCALYAACGAETLCRTCRLHPRFVAEYGGWREIMPGLSCPAWVELYLLSDEAVTFVTRETEELPIYNEIDGALFYRLAAARRRALTLLGDRSVPLRERAEGLLRLAEETDGTTEEGVVPGRVVPAYVEKLRHLEILTPRWRRLLAAPHPRGERPPWRDIVGEKVLIYYIFRFWLRGVYSGRVLPWAKLAVWSWIVTEYLGRDAETRKKYCEVIRLYSKEIEHSAENLNTLWRALCRRTGRYSAEGLRKAWEEIV